jgi:thioredoxin-related protein
MKLLAIACFSVFCLNYNLWTTDFEAAKKNAAEKHQFILLNFSGSDWCGPCIRLRKEIFESAEFTAYAADKLVLVNADFPRLKKNQLPKEQQEQNEKLADQYNSEGHFPYTLLLSPAGKIIKVWDGFPNESAVSFINSIKVMGDAGE